MRGDSEMLWTLELGRVTIDFRYGSFRYFLMACHKSIVLFF